MSDFLDDELRRALRPMDPGEDFTRRVLARVRPQTSHRTVRSNGLSSRALRWLPAALAASLLVAIMIQHERAEIRTMEDGLRAREELIAALRVTSEKLDLAYGVVHDRSANDDDGV